MLIRPGSLKHPREGLPAKRTDGGVRRPIDVDPFLRGEGCPGVFANESPGLNSTAVPR